MPGTDFSLLGMPRDYIMLHRVHVMPHRALFCCMVTTFWVYSAAWGSYSDARGLDSAALGRYFAAQRLYMAYMQCMLHMLYLAGGATLVIGVAEGKTLHPLVPGVVGGKTMQPGPYYQTTDSKITR